MASLKERKQAAEQQAEEKARREQERKDFQEHQVHIGLKRAFKRLDKKNDNRIDVDELREELQFLGFKADKAELDEYIWEVDDDDDGGVDWDEFCTAYYRSRHDKTGHEPRRLFYLIEFMLADKDHSGMVDLGELVSIWYTRFGKEEGDAKVTESFGEDFSTGAHEISFADFVGIQRKASRKEKHSVNAMLPQVKPVTILDGALL